LSPYKQWFFLVFAIGGLFSAIMQPVEMVKAIIQKARSGRRHFGTTFAIDKYKTVC